MPTYLKNSIELEIPAADWDSPNGDTIPKDTMWGFIKEAYPVHTGTLHSEQHEIFTKSIVDLFSQNNNREDNDESAIAAKLNELGVWFYVEDLEHDEDLKKVTMTWNAYFPDQDIADDFIDFLKTLESPWGLGDGDTLDLKTVDFHRPYML
jgi:hypothetical protein